MTNPETLDKLSADGRFGAGAALVALTGVLREGERLYAVFSAGPSEGVRPIFTTDLAACAAWQRRVPTELQILITHATPLEAPPRERRPA